MCNKNAVIWSGLENSSHISLYLCALFIWEFIMDYWKIVLKLAEKAAKKGEVPVGAILVVDNSKKYFKGFNKREKKSDILGHAEVECIKKANKCLHTWKLDNCELYVSLKPCTMCETIIRQSRIKKVHYLIEKDTNKREYYQTEFNQEAKIAYQDEYKTILKDFFKKIR